MSASSRVRWIALLAALCVLWACWGCWQAINHTRRQLLGPGLRAPGATGVFSTFPATAANSRRK